MDNVNKTLYIPLYGKAFVSKKGLFLRDTRAEEIWSAAAFPLKGKARSRWLAYYMGIRAAVFDAWVKAETETDEECLVLHVGCGLDSRVTRVGETRALWYDVDLREVIEERRRYYTESDRYRMLVGDARATDWLASLPSCPKTVVVMEGVSMYLTPTELQAFIAAIGERFSAVSLLMDCYTSFAAKMSKYRNPVNTVGVTRLYGIDEPRALQGGGVCFACEREMTPRSCIEQLKGAERRVFAALYAGGLSKKLYKLYEYRKKE